jgi:hypothetical protein
VIRYTPIESTVSDMIHSLIWYYQSPKIKYSGSVMELVLLSSLASLRKNNYSACTRTISTNELLLVLKLEKYSSMTSHM